MIAGEKPDDKLALSVASGDINGDGYDDMIMEANDASAEEKTNAGITYVIFGSAQLKLEEMIDLAYGHHDLLRIEGENSGDNLGSLVVSTDLNSDDYDDIIIPAFGSVQSNLMPF